MSLYQYNGSSLIKKARFITNEMGGQRAYLYADPHITVDQLNDAIEKLDSKGYLCVPHQHEGTSVLEVRRFGKSEKLLNHLKSTALIDGPPKKTDLDQDKVSIFDWIKKRLLLVSTLLYIVGDISFIVYEHMEAEKTHQKTAGELALPETLADKLMERVAGLGYLLGSLTSMTSILLKQDGSELELRNAARNFVKIAKEEGIDFADHDTVVTATRDNPNQQHNQFRDTFTKYPAELMNLCFAAAGTGIAYNAHRKGKRLRIDEQADPTLKDKKTHQIRKVVSTLDIGLGAGTTFSGVTASVVKEKKRDPHQPRKHGLEGVKEWFQEMPMRIASIGYLVSTVIHLVSSILERRAIQTDNKTLPKDKQEKVTGTAFRLTFVITNLIAEVIMGFASKGHGKGVKADESVDVTFGAMLAQKVRHLDPEAREEMIEKMTKIASRADVLGTPQSILTKIVRIQLNQQDNNLWADAMVKTPQPQQQQQDTLIAVNHKKPALIEKKPAAQWTHKVADAEHIGIAASAAV